MMEKGTGTFKETFRRKLLTGLNEPIHSEGGSGKPRKGPHAEGEKKKSEMNSHIWSELHPDIFISSKWRDRGALVCIRRSTRRNTTKLKVKRGGKS